jgi:hypothetical protein
MNRFHARRAGASSLSTFAAVKAPKANPLKRVKLMPNSCRDDELIAAVRADTRQQDARMLREMASHAPCTCSAEAGSDHKPKCPMFVWESAARALDLLAER